jgi:cellulose synthase/poly-beta-1,6-N-acetylglucosamine synthase-like glycosyltransferase
MISNPNVWLERAVLLLAILGFAAVLFVFTVYLLYFMLIYRCHGNVSNYLRNIEASQKFDFLPSISVIINTYNEAKIIRRKIEDISRLEYPREKLEVFVIDDCSSDGTWDIAQKAFADFKISGKVIRNTRRLGLNESMNLAFSRVSNDVVCVTDSDVMLDKNALKIAVAVLENFEGAGGVTGKIVPVYRERGVATISEDSYRFFYDRCMLSESSIHSAFPGNGPLMVFKKSLVSSIPADYGSTDANIAMRIVKSGRRFLYVPEALIYEPVPERISQQRLQKVRRARRLIQVFLHNIYVFGNRQYGKFGTVIFPLKFLMHVVCPLLMFLGLSFVFLGVALSDVLAVKFALLILVSFTIGVLMFSRRIRAFFVSFVLHQAYLLIGLLSSFKKSVYWKTIERKVE